MTQPNDRGGELPPEPTIEPEVAAAPPAECLCAVRIVCRDGEVYEQTLDFYRRLFGRDEDEAYGTREDPQQGSVWRLQAQTLDLIVTREREVAGETFVDQGPAWLCFVCSDPDARHRAATASGLELLNDPIDTAFGTRAFYVNDPGGLPLHVGASWPRG